MPLKKKKLGFPLPMNDWMKDDKIKEILLDDKTTKEIFLKKNKLKNYLILKKLLMIL